MIIFVLGDSGVGKDTIVDMLVDVIGEDKAYKIRSWTTRKPRYDGEDTHNFLWWPGSIRKDRINAFYNDRIGRDLIAWSYIGGEYYWTEGYQFEKTDYEFYIIDEDGLRRALKKIKEKYMVLMIERPEELISIDKPRLDRNIHLGYRDVDITFFNVFNDIESLRDNIEDLAEVIKNFE